MFGMGMPEIMLILAVALVVIGPKKLPGLAKSIGRAMGEFKSATRDFKRSMDLDEDLRDAKDSLSDLKDIPTFDPDIEAYKRETADQPHEHADEDEVETEDPASHAEPDQPTNDQVAEDPPSSGAKPHG